MKNKKNGGSIFFVILAIIAVAAGVFVFLEYRDRQSIELFINDGEQVSTTAICTPMEAEEIVFCCDGTVKINVEKHELI